MSARIRVPLLVAILATGVHADEKGTAGAPGTVGLPRSEYDRLLDRAAHPLPPPPVPPADQAMAPARVVARVEPDLARGTVRLRSEVWRPGPTEVPLVEAAVAVTAQAAGRTPPLFRRGAALSAVAPGPGPFELDLDWAAALSQEAGRTSFLVPAVRAGLVRASLELPEDAGDVRLEPAGFVLATARERGRTRVEAELPAGQAVRVSWTSQTRPAERPARFLADVKSLLTVDDADLRLTSLIEVRVLQGAPERFSLALPEGFEVTRVTGAAQREVRPGLLEIPVEPGVARHAFLVAMQREMASGARVEARLPSLVGAQREVGEVLVESVGTVEVSVAEAEGLRRMDLREAAPALRQLVGDAPHAAFRYQSRGGPAPAVALQAQRFPPAAVLAAFAESAQATTLVTAEGRRLTELALTVHNQAQPYLRVELPPGATIVSADVAGEAVKPARGAGGMHVPLLRPGFRPEGPYAVSFVYQDSGAAFGRKGRAQLSLPRVDVPVTVLRWEVFLPDRYQVRDFGGNAGVEAEPIEFGIAGGLEGGVVGGVVGGVMGGVVGGLAADTAPAGTGSLSGRAMDSEGGPLPGAEVVAEAPGFRRRVQTGADGAFTLAGLPAATVRLTIALAGFTTFERRLNMGAGQRRPIDARLEVAAVQETVTVMAEAPEMGRLRRAPDAPSANVFNLQRRVAGVLPIRVEVPRAGTSHRFVRLLVVDEPTMLAFDFRRR